MKLSQLPILALAVAALAGSGCSRDEFNFESRNSGSLRITLAASNSLSADDITRADTDPITMADALGVTTFDPAAFITANKDKFLLTITDASGKEVYENKKIADFTGENALKFDIANNYKVEAVLEGTQGFYGTADADKGTPAYIGEATFNIVGGDTPTEVEIPVKLSQSILKFAYKSVSSSSDTATAADDETTTETDMFDKYFADWTVTVKQSNETVATFTKSETRGALLEAEVKTQIEYSLTPAQPQQGTTATPITGTISDVELEENTFYTFSFRLKDVGGANRLTIKINDEIAEEFDIEIEDGIDLEDDQYQPSDDEEDTTPEGGNEGDNENV